MKHQYILPITLAIIVVVLPATLITVAAASPYTHANLTAFFDPSYTRTEQTSVGAPLLYRSPALAVQVDATAPMEERGQALFVAHGCAGCHGIDGRGSAVGPALVTDLEVLRDNVRRGPGGMPVFSIADVTDYDLTAISAYLKSVNK